MYVLRRRAFTGNLFPLHGVLGSRKEGPPQTIIIIITFYVYTAQNLKSKQKLNQNDLILQGWGDEIVKVLPCYTVEVIRAGIKGSHWHRFGHELHWT